MKKIYWRPHKASRQALILIAAVAVAGMAATESLQVRKRQPHYREKMAAARLARRCMDHIKSEKVKRGVPIDPDVDPASTGLLGSSVTPVTSNTGYLSAKLSATNPNFAAVIVELLKRAAVQEGDTVAVGLSGSFPGLNVSAYAALRTLGIKPIAITSAAASEWGATDPQFMWLDMEKSLHEAGLINVRSVAASRGGIDDRGFGMSKEGRDLIDAGIARVGIEKIDVRSLAEGIDRRMELYGKHAGNQLVKAYLNVGGGSASVGTHVGKKLFKPGLNRRPPAEQIDSVMLRFVKQDIPVIHLSGVSELAARFGLPAEPKAAVPVGEGPIFDRDEYNPWIAGGSISGILLAMFAFLRLHFGIQILRTGRAIKPGAAPEPMA
jgi:poly-gamma-glutamate system protein